MEMAQFILAPLTALDLFGYIIITEESNSLHTGFQGMNRIKAPGFYFLFIFFQTQSTMYFN